MGATELLTLTMLAFLNIFSELKNARVLKLFSIFKPKCVTHVFTHFVQRLDMYYAASELLTIRMLTLLNYFPAFKNSNSIR
jgi:hypothetical protein